MIRHTVLVVTLLLAAAGMNAADINGDRSETILLPLAFAPTGAEIPGAYGTVWTGVVWMHNRNAVEVFLQSCGMVICTGFLPDRMGVVNIPIGQRPELGFLLYPAAEHAQNLTFSNRIFERTRRGQPRGVEVPVVREGEFFATERVFLGVPVGPEVRASVRVYDPWPHTSVPRPASPVLQSVTIEILTEQQTVIGTTTLRPEVLLRESSTDRSRPGLAAIHDLAGIFPPINDLPFVHVRVTPVPAGAEYYAMISVTDNETQTVAIITAQ